MKEIQIEDVIETIYLAGQSVKDVYTRGDFEKVLKEDDSPLTKVDLVSNDIVSQHLVNLAPDISIVSEEKVVPWNERKAFERYWLIDPLDGTKEFIKK